MSRGNIWIGVVLIWLAGLGASVAADDEAAPLRIGLTPVILEDQLSFLDEWQAYLEQHVGRDVRFVRRNSYGEVVDLALRGRIDFAWLCGYPYVQHEARLDLLAVPLFQDAPLYEAYLIVPADDEQTESITDLAGKVFAYSDPNSNSGWLYGQQLLDEAGVDPERFFRRTFFTFGHRKVVEAVAERVAHGGLVDGYVWETLARTRPDLTGRTRIVHRSEPFGFPPLVASPGASEGDRQALRAALFGMDRDEQGQALLEKLNLAGFQAGDDELYDGIRVLKRRVDVGRFPEPPDNYEP